MADYDEWVVQVGDARACTLASLRRAGGEGVCASGQEGGCAGGAVLHYRTQHSTKPLSSVTLGKHFIGKGFFAEYFFAHSAKTLPNVENHSAKKSTRQIKNHKKPKNSKTFFKLWEQLSNHYPLPYPSSYHFSLLKFWCIFCRKIFH